MKKCTIKIPLLAVILLSLFNYTRAQDCPAEYVHPNTGVAYISHVPECYGDKYEITVSGVYDYISGCPSSSYGAYPGTFTFQAEFGQTYCYTFHSGVLHNNPHYVPGPCPTGYCLDCGSTYSEIVRESSITIPAAIPCQISVSATAHPTSDYGCNDGSITFSGTTNACSNQYYGYIEGTIYGGYYTSGESVTVPNLPAGTYVVHTYSIVPQYWPGCEATDTVVITQAPCHVSASITPTSATGWGCPDGKLDVIGHSSDCVAYTTSLYHVETNSYPLLYDSTTSAYYGNNGDHLFNHALYPGHYILTITTIDNGCSASYNITIDPPSCELITTVSHIDPDNGSCSNGQITFTAHTNNCNGYYAVLYTLQGTYTGYYHYQVKSDSLVYFNNLPPGMYVIKTQGLSGVGQDCDRADTVVLHEKDCHSPYTFATQPASNFGCNSGAITFTNHSDCNWVTEVYLNGNFYTYLYNSSYSGFYNDTLTWNYLPAGTYTLKNTSGTTNYDGVVYTCEVWDTVVVGSPVCTISVTANHTNALSYDCTGGSILLHVSVNDCNGYSLVITRASDNAVYSNGNYNSNTQQDISFDNLPAGTYLINVIGISPGSCSWSGSITILCQADSDNDGVPDVSDNCPYTYNPTQAYPYTYYIDNDHDGYGTGAGVGFCDYYPPYGYSFNNTDCNDLDVDIHVPQQFYVDADHDGYGSSNTAMLCVSTPPIGYSLNNTDCNDNNANVHDILTITNASTTPSSLIGQVGNGTISVTAPGATQFSIDGANYQSSNVFTGLPNGTYTVYARTVNCADVRNNVVVGGGFTCVHPVISSISGSLNICTNITANPVYTAIYTGTPSSFSWTVTGGSIVGNANWSSIEVQFAPGATTATVSAVANSPWCGNSASKKITITRKGPVTPGTINATSSDICKSMSGVSYSIAAVTGTLLYKWAVPPGCTILSPSSAISGPNNDTVLTTSTSIQVAFPANFITGSIKVASMNDCGQSSFKSLTVKKLLPAKPAMPKVTGEVLRSICSSSADITLSIKQVAYADGYAWKLPAGCIATGVKYSNAVNFTSISGDSIIVAPTPGSSDSVAITVRLTGSSSFTSGVVKVYAYRTCSNYEQTLPATVTLVKTLPLAVKGLLPKTNFNACGPYLQDTVVEFTVTKNTTGVRPTGYLWSVTGTGVSIYATVNGTQVMNLPVGTLSTQTDSSTVAIRVRFSSAAVSNPVRSVSVQPLRFCSDGGGPVTKNTIQILPLLPALAGSVVQPCVGEEVIYKVTSGNTGINSFIWTRPSNTILIAGSLTGSSDTSITLRYTSTVSGKVTVKSISACGTSTASSLAVTPIQTCTIATRSIQANKFVGEITGATKAIIYPNPNAGSYHVLIETANKTDNAYVQVINMFGQVVSEITGPNNAGNIDIKMNESRLAAGIYTIRYQVGNEIGLVKMVIEP